MPLHDAFGVNCKKERRYWKSWRRCLVYGLRGVYWIIEGFTWRHDYPSVIEGKIVVYYYIIITMQFNGIVHPPF